jgi:hypothetical protein
MVLVAALTQISLFPGCNAGIPQDETHARLAGWYQTQFSHRSADNGK